MPQKDAKIKFSDIIAEYEAENKNLKEELERKNFEYCKLLENKNKVISEICKHNQDLLEKIKPNSSEEIFLDSLNEKNSGFRKIYCFNTEQTGSEICFNENISIIEQIVDKNQENRKSFEKNLKNIIKTDNFEEILKNNVEKSEYKDLNHKNTEELNLKLQNSLKKIIQLENIIKNYKIKALKQTEIIESFKSELLALRKY